MPDFNINWSDRVTNVQRYALAAGTALCALALRIALTPYIGDRDRYLAACAVVAFCAWYCGPGPSILATAISALGLWFWFAIQNNWQAVSYQSDFAGLLGFLFFSALLIVFAEAARRAKAHGAQNEEWHMERESRLRRNAENMAHEIRHGTVELQEKTAQAIAQAHFLDLANDAIFVRGADGRISYWNQGAERLYGWTREEAVGCPVHTLLHTVFPVPFAAVANSERWEGELVQLKRDGSSVTVASRWTTLRDEQGKVSGWLEICTDITARKQLEEAARRLTGRILSMQDDERRRIARELHDSLGQYLVSVKVNLDLLSKEVDGPQRNLIAECIYATEQCLAETRTISHLLHPPLLDEAGFASAARWYVEGFAQRSSFQVELDLPPEWHRLEHEVEIVLFRVLQESLTNIHRHSGGTSVRILLRTDAEQVYLEIWDNGRGIPEERLNSLQDDGLATGVGIAGMRERVRELGGSFEIKAAFPGTTVVATVPYRHPVNLHSEEGTGRDVSAA